MTDIEDFSEFAQGKAQSAKSFPDLLSKMERVLTKDGQLTLNQTIFFERYWNNSRKDEVFETEDELQHLKARFLKQNPSFTINIGKNGKIQIRNNKGKFQKQPTYFKEFYKERNKYFKKMVGKK